MFLPGNPLKKEMVNFYSTLFIVAITIFILGLVSYFSIESIDNFYPISAMTISILIGMPLMIFSGLKYLKIKKEITESADYSALFLLL
jgi:uncharacterized membrane protein YadS